MILILILTLILTLTLTLTFLLTFLLTLFLGCSVVSANLTLLLSEGVRLADAERRPAFDFSPVSGMFFEQIRGVQRRGTHSGVCPGSRWEVRGGCARCLGAGLAFSR